MEKDIVVKLNNITKGYNNKIILHDFNLEIANNEFIGIIGRSGAGKSTLLNIIGLLDRPDEGIVIIQGKDHAEKNKKKFFRDVFGYIFQNYALMDNETVYANLEVALDFQKLTKQQKIKLMQDALTQVGLSCSLKSKVYTLSGGEQQRLAVARVILKKCDIILADEPTGALDQDNRNQIIHLLEQLHKEGKTIIVVTHDTELTNSFTRLINLT